MASFDLLIKLAARWAPILTQSAVWLGALSIGLIWGSLGLHLKFERGVTERSAIQQSDNLARAFEKHLSDSLLDIDRSLNIMRRSYVLYPDGFDFRDWYYSSRLFEDEILQVGIIGPDGLLKMSSAEADRKSVV